jgi:hypothetical protein
VIRPATRVGRRVIFEGGANRNLTLFERLRLFSNPETTVKRKGADHLTVYDDLGTSRRRIVGETWFWILVSILTIVAVGALVFGIRWATAPAKGKLAAREQIQSGQYRIAAYDHFFDLCSSIQGLEGQLAAQRAALSTATGDEEARISANVAGIEGERARAIAEYNADARKSYTLGQFRASDLPYRLDAKETTTCGA